MYRKRAFLCVFVSLILGCSGHQSSQPELVHTHQGYELHTAGVTRDGELVLDFQQINFQSPTLQAWAQHRRTYFEKVNPVLDDFVVEERYFTLRDETTGRFLGLVYFEDQEWKYLEPESFVDKWEHLTGLTKEYPRLYPSGEISREDVYVPGGYYLELGGGSCYAVFIPDRKQLTIKLW